MEFITSQAVLVHGPSRLPDIERTCKYMTNTRRFSSEIRSVLLAIGVPDVIFRETKIQFSIDAESKIPEWFNAKIRGEFDKDWEAYD